MLFRNLIISAFVALAAASDLAGRGEGTFTTTLGWNMEGENEPHR